MNAADAVEQMSTMVDMVPTRERHVRPLLKLEETERRVEVAAKIGRLLPEPKPGERTDLQPLSSESKVVIERNDATRYRQIARVDPETLTQPGTGRRRAGRG